MQPANKLKFAFNFVTLKRIELFGEPKVNRKLDFVKPKAASALLRSLAETKNDKNILLIDACILKCNFIVSWAMFPYMF
jgi:hypothetical protein